MSEGEGPRDVLRTATRRDIAGVMSRCLGFQNRKGFDEEERNYSRCSQAIFGEADVMSGLQGT